MQPNELDTTAHVLEWVAEQWRKAVAAAMEMFAGEAPAVELSSQPHSESLSWRVLKFDFAPGATVFIGTEAGDERRLVESAAVLAGGSEEDGDADSAYREFLEQAAAGLAQSFTGRFDQDVGLAGIGAGRPPTAAATQCIEIHLPGGDRAKQWLAVSPELVQAVVSLAGQSREGGAEPQQTPQRAQLAAPETAAPRRDPVDLLLDVELPVSASFGRTYLPLGDVLELTSGSIVELNRSVSEPVEIIVNNCVIARGEVVVVEGNYGVRITEIISRCERLRTLI